MATLTIAVMTAMPAMAQSLPDPYAIPGDEPDRCVIAIPTDDSGAHVGPAYPAIQVPLEFHGGFVYELAVDGVVIDVFDATPIEGDQVFQYRLIEVPDRHLAGQFTVSVGEDVLLSGELDVGRCWWGDIAADTAAGQPVTVQMAFDHVDGGTVVRDVAQPLHGTAEVIGTDRVRYTPPSEFHGTVEIPVTLGSSSFPVESGATVTVTVNVGASDSSGEASIVDPPNSVEAGAGVSIAAAGFLPGEDIAGVLNSDPVDLGVQTADDNGDVTFTFSVPSDITPGTHTVTLTGLTSQRTASVSFEVTATGSGDDDGDEAKAETEAPLGHNPGLSSNTGLPGMSGITSWLPGGLLVFLGILCAAAMIHHRRPAPRRTH